jgi:hypothetical protein
MGDALARTDLGAGHKARLVTMGFYSGCALREDETARCWSSNDPATEERPAPTGGRHVARLVGAHGVLAHYDDGSIGMVSGGGALAALPAPPAGSPAGLKVLVLGGSGIEACAIFEGNVGACTQAGARALPQTFAAPVAELAITELGPKCWRFTDGRVQCNVSGTGKPWATDGAMPATVRLGQPATALAAGLEHVCALLVNGEVKCWQNNDSLLSELGQSIATATSWPSVDLGTRP